MGRGPKQTFLQRRHPAGQEAHEKMLSFTHYSWYRCGRAGRGAWLWVGRQGCVGEGGQAGVRGCGWAGRGAWVRVGRQGCPDVGIDVGLDTPLKRGKPEN